MENTEQKQAQTPLPENEKVKKYLHDILEDIRMAIDKATLDDTIVFGHHAKKCKSRLLIFGDKRALAELLHRAADTL